MSFFLTLAEQRQAQKASGTKVSSSKSKFLFYGEHGKSTVSLAYSLINDKRPVYVMTPAGGSHALAPYFQNAEIESINGLTHLEAILDGLEEEFANVLRLRQVITANETARIEKAKEIYSAFKLPNGDIVNIWDKMYDAAINQELPFSAIVLEEANLVGTWVYDKVKDELGLDDVIGQDKSQRGFDWNIYEKRILTLFGRLLKLPATIILATADKQPVEQQTTNKVQPDICSGKGNRKLQQMIGNIFYFYKDEGKYMVRLQDSKGFFAKDKIVSPFSEKTLDETIDLTRRPQYFWEYLEDKATLEKPKKQKK